jgi:GxxExxY protein
VRHSSSRDEEKIASLPACNSRNREFQRQWLRHIGCCSYNHNDDPRTYAIIGAAIEVHRVMGTGFLELLYKDALAIEFERREIPFVAEVPCQVEYKGHILRGNYRMDFVCFKEVVLEIKARSAITPADHAQLLS